MVSTLSLTLLLATLGILESPTNNEPEALAAVELGGPTWSGGQLLDSDDKGEVRLLRCETLAVYEVTSEGVLEEPQMLEEHPGATAPGSVLGAALSSDGDSWLLRVFPPFGRLRLFRGGEEELVGAAPFHITGVAFQRDTPLISVTAMTNSGPAIAGAKSGKDESIALMVHQKDRWQPFLTESASDEGDLELDRWQREYRPREYRMARGRKGALWVADHNAYRVRLLSPSGRVRTEFSLDGATMVLREPNEEEQLALVDASVDGTVPKEMAIRVASRSKPVRRIAAIAPWGGQLFILAYREAGGYWLDRYDPVLDRLDRLQLAGQDYSGIVTLAAGREGIFAAEYKGTANRWWISWERLAAADWQEVTRDGYAPAPRAAESEVQATESLPR